MAMRVRINSAVSADHVLASIDESGLTRYAQFGAKTNLTKPLFSCVNGDFHFNDTGNTADDLNCSDTWGFIGIVYNPGVAMTGYFMGGTQKYPFKNNVWGTGGSAALGGSGSITALRIGDQVGNNKPTDAYIEDFYFFNTNISAAQMRWLAYRRVPPLSAYRWLPMYDGSHPEKDFSGNARDMTVTGTPSASANRPIVPYCYMPLMVA